MEEALPDLEPEPRSRPTGVSVVAVLAMVMGFISFCFSPLSILQLVFMKEPVYQAMRNDTVVFYVSVGSSAFAWFLSIFMIALGFGLWKLKEWARSGTVMFCVFSVIWAIASGILNVLYVTPRAMEIALASQPQKLPPDVLKYTLMFSYIAAGFMILVMCGVYAAIGIYMNRGSVKDAFRPEA